MSLRPKATLVAMLLAGPLIASPPVWASSGGAYLGTAPLPTSTSTSTTGRATSPLGGPAFGAVASGGAAASAGATATQDGDLVATATGDGITVTANNSVLLGPHLAYTGTTSATSAGAPIVVQRFDPGGSAWISVATGTVGAGGAFSALWRTNDAGRLTMRTVLERKATTSQVGPTSPTLQITVYRPALATFYGEGFFGKKTACGEILKRATLGVASRTLKCGTSVQIYYRGQTIVVPVIDRGPYANDASWDLTQATARALVITGTETVGEVSG